jgi:hypothetical protein
MNKRDPNKPRLSEFMLKGIPLAVALDALERWDSLSDIDKANLGFSDQKPRARPPMLRLIDPSK